MQIAMDSPPDEDEWKAIKETESSQSFINRFVGSYGAEFALARLLSFH